MPQSTLPPSAPPKRSAWHIIWYPIIALAAVNIAYQLATLGLQSRRVDAAIGGWIIGAVAAQAAALFVLVPMMRHFYHSAGKPLSRRRATRVMVTGLGLGRVIPAGEYLFWRRHFSASPDDTGTTPQFAVLYYTAMVGGLAAIFVVSEILGLTLFPDRLIGDLAGNFIWLPVGLTAAFIVIALLGRFLRLRGRLKLAAARILGSSVLSPVQILRIRRLGLKTIGVFSAAAVSSWLLEAVVFWCCLTALRQDVPLELAVFGYTFARIFTVLPIIPGGVGETETAAVLFFAAYGYGAAPVLTATVLFRLINYWFPLIMAGLSYAASKVFGEETAKRA